MRKLMPTVAGDRDGCRVQVWSVSAVRSSFRPAALHDRLRVISNQRPSSLLRDTTMVSRGTA
jgi:hypothetical protein